MGALKPWHLLVLLICMVVVATVVAVGVYLSARRRR